MAKKFFALALLIALVSLGIFSQKFFEQPEKTDLDSEEEIVIGESEMTRSGNFVSINVPAINNEGKGVMTTLTVETIEGSRGVLVDINNILFFIDTQSSIRIAERVAENITGKELSNVRLIYTIETNASVIEGASAGAALTIATVAALENKEINPDVIITGTVNPDGSIGRVGALLEKAKASREAGAKLFLVPEGQGFRTLLKPERKCTQIESFTYCEVVYVKKKIEFSDLGIEIREVSNITEALKYFVQ